MFSLLWLLILYSLFLTQETEWSPENITTFKTNNSSTQFTILHFTQSLSAKILIVPHKWDLFLLFYYSLSLTYYSPATLAFCSVQTKFVPATGTLHLLFWVPRWLLLNLHMASSFSPSDFAQKASVREKFPNHPVYICPLPILCHIILFNSLYSIFLFNDLPGYGHFTLLTSLN